MSADKTRQEVRQEMYKNCNRSLFWKEQFRKRCLERLQDSRGRYLLARRSLNDKQHIDMATSEMTAEQHDNYDDSEEEIKTAQTGILKRVPDIDKIMREEFERMKGEVSLSEDSRSSNIEGDFQEIDNFCDKKYLKGKGRLAAENSHREGLNTSSFKSRDDYCRPSDVHTDNYLNVNSLVSWYEDIYDKIRSELNQVQENKEKQQRQSEQNGCDEYLQNEERELCSAIKALSTEDVLCPLCEKLNLYEQKNTICCKCGLKIDMEQDSVTLKYVKESLAVGSKEHSQKCDSKPAFSLIQTVGISNLLMSCQMTNPPLDNVWQMCKIMSWRGFYPTGDCDFLFVIV